MDVIKQQLARFSFWVRFVKHVLPEGLAKEIPQIVKIRKCLDLIDCAMVSPISTFDAKNTSDAFKHVPDLF